MKIGKYDYPWKVGHRLHKSRRYNLPYDEALKYYKSLIKCKTRFIYQQIPLNIIITDTIRRRSKQLREAVCDRNPIFEFIQKHKG